MFVGLRDNAACGDSSYAGAITELKELRALERSWWLLPTGWKRKASIALGKPLAFLLAMREASSGVARYGNAVAHRHGISAQRQFLMLFSAAAAHRFRAEEFYLYQIYNAARQRMIRSFIPKDRVTLLLEFLIHRTNPVDTAALMDKRLFRERGERNGLPTIPVFAEFKDRRMTPREWHPATPLPSLDLFAKPANLWCGVGAKHWDCVGKHVFRDATGREVGSDDIVDEVAACSVRAPYILQPRLRNHPALDRVSGGGLCTVRLVTCKRPANDEFAFRSLAGSTISAGAPDAER
jgi:hypothetical protein